MVTPISQLSSRGLRKAPVKKIRARCITIAATKTSAAQWWVCRISRPARTSQLSRTVEAYAAEVVAPSSGA